MKYAVEFWSRFRHDYAKVVALAWAFLVGRVVFAGSATHTEEWYEPFSGLLSLAKLNLLLVTIVTIPLVAWVLHDMLTHRQTPPAVLYALLLSCGLFLGAASRLNGSSLSPGLFVLASFLVVTAGGVFAMIRESRRGSDERGA